MWLAGMVGFICRGGKKAYDGRRTSAADKSIACVIRERVDTLILHAAQLRVYPDNSLKSPGKEREIDRACRPAHRPVLPVCMYSCTRMRARAGVVLKKGKPVDADTHNT